MKMDKKIIEAFEKGESFLTHVHLGPDPDSVASVLALKLGLESLGKRVRVFCEGVITDNFLFLPGAYEIQIQRMDEALSLNFDTYVTMDTAKWNLATRMIQIPEIHQTVINLDHHPDNTIKTKYSHIDGASPCTTLIIDQLFKQLKVKMTPEIATCILYGILGDTGVFQNFGTTSESIRIAADLIDQGGDYQGCMSALTRSYTIDHLKAIALMIKNLNKSEQGDYIWMTINAKEWQQFDKTTDIGGMANQYAGKIEGTLFGATLVEKEAGVTKGAIRSHRPDIDVAQIARLLGGGGHKGAAGFRVEKNLKNAEKEFLKAVSYLKSKGKL